MTQRRVGFNSGYPENHVRSHNSHNPTRREAGRVLARLRLTSDGFPDKKSLVIRGWQRAGSWSALIRAQSCRPKQSGPSLNQPSEPKCKNRHQPRQTSYREGISLPRPFGPTPEYEVPPWEEVQIPPPFVAQPVVDLVPWRKKPKAGPILRLLPTVRAYRVCRPSGTARALTSCSVSIARLLKTPWSFRQLCPCLLSGDSATQMG